VSTLIEHYRRAQKFQNRFAFIAYEVLFLESIRSSIPGNWRILGKNRGGEKLIFNLNHRRVMAIPTHYHLLKSEH